VPTGLAGARGSSVGLLSAAAALMAVLGGQSQHEERRGVSGCLVQILARRRPVGGLIGAWRPTHGTHWLNRGMEQQFDECLVSSGFDWGALRPTEARGEPPAGVAVIPGKRALGLFFAS